jgi:hypothetical protein
MTGEVTLNVANDQNETMQFNSLSELAELLKLAGISGQADTVAHDDIETDDNGTFDVEIDGDGSICMPQTSENAEYDYGKNPTSRKGFVYDIDPYKYQGDAELPTRMVPAKSGDNPLIRFRENAKSFAAYLQEVERPRRRKTKR